MSINQEEKWKRYLERHINHIEQKATLTAFVKTLHRCSVETKLLHLGRLNRVGRRVNKPFEEATRAQIDDFMSTIENDSTYDGYVQTIKCFYKFLDKKIAKHLKVKKHLKRFTPAELLTPEEVVRLANATASQMYKTCILTIYESAARISEVLHLRIGDVVFDWVRNKKGETQLVATLHFARSKGDVPKQPVVVSTFAYELKQWIESHPHKNNINAFVFYSQKSSPNAGVPLKPRAVQKKLAKAKQITGIEKKCNPHWLRHSMLSHLVNKHLYNEQILMWRAGWTSTVMCKRYIHSGAQIENKVYLAKLGLTREGEAKDPAIKPKPCPHCSQFNPATNMTCDYCGSPLDLAEYRKALEEKQFVELSVDGFRSQIKDLWKMLDNMRERLAMRSKEELVRFVATANPTEERLAAFMRRKAMEQQLIEELEQEGVVRLVSGIWYYIRDRDQCYAPEYIQA